MTASVLQERQTSAGGATVSSFALAFSSAVTSGSSIHTFGKTASTNTITCADGSNGAHTSLDQNTAFSDGTVAQFNKDSSAAASITVTISFTADTFPAIWIREVGGTGGVDTSHGINTASTGTTRTGSSLTPTQQPGLISAMLFNDTNPSGAADTGSGFTASSPASGWDFGFGSNDAFCESKRYTSTSAIAATFVSVGTTDQTRILSALYKETSGGLTLALVGQAATFSAGSLAPSSSKALLGQGITSSTGSLVPSLSKALLGSSGTLTAGTLTPSTTAGLLGSLVTGTAGIVAASGGTGGNLTIALTGQRSAFAQGALGVSISVALAGASSTGAAGTLSPDTSAGLLGASSTTSTGTLGVGISPALVGTVLQGTPGTLQGGATFSLTGNLATFSLGILNPSLTVPLTGIFNSTNAGQLVSSGGDIITTQTASMLLIRRGFRKKR